MCQLGVAVDQLVFAELVGLQKPELMKHIEVIYIYIYIYIKIHDGEVYDLFLGMEKKQVKG
jgi:hypothetical protein